MAEFPLLKGTRLRLTRTNSCGLPIAGPASRMVTKGFVQVTAAAEMKDANEIEQTNANGDVCVTDRTAPERKRYNIDLELCQVNTGLIAMLTGVPQVLNYADVPVGFRDRKEVDDEYGAALEIWTAGKSEDDCPEQLTDDIFDNPDASGRSYGYLLFGGIEWRISSDIVVQADLTTVTLSGITMPLTHWGRGPYNVVATDSDHTPGRLLEPMAPDQHYHLERTPIAPPDVTPGSEPVALAVASIFTGPPWYFGGPGGEASVDVAPAQPSGSGS